MSLFAKMSVTCPSCGAALEMDAVESVNADRRPDLREAILEQSFQEVTCPECGAVFRLEPELNYLDIGRGQWISAFAADRVVDWVESEDTANAAFDTAYGAQAGEAAQEIGRELSPRVVFGWPAIREKIVLNALGLDDATVELMKLAMYRGLGDLPMALGVDLRVLGADEAEIEVARQNAGTGELVEVLRVPRSFYDDIAADAQSWEEIRAALLASPFVDVQKLYMGEGRPGG